MIVYTAAIGETDTVQAPTVVDPDVRYLCFTDRPCPSPYERIAVPTSTDGTPSSRVFKVLAMHPLLRDAAITVWHDASYRLLTDLSWARRAMASADLATMRHPRRDRIEEEAVAISRYRYVTIQRALELVQEYRAAGFLGKTLSSAGLIVRKISPVVAEFNARWFEEVQRWGWRDQASFDYAAWCAGATVQHLSGVVRHNPYAEWRVPVAA